MANYVTVTLTLPNGKRKYFRGATRKEAEKKRDEAKLHLAMGVDIGNNTTVEELANLWLHDYKEGEVRESSYLNFSRILDCHVIPALGWMKVRDVKPAHIKHMMKEKAGLANNTQKIILRVTKAVFALAVENELILRNPCVKSIHAAGEEAKESVPLTPDQAQAMLDKSVGTKLRLFVLIGLKAGLRRGELLGLQWSDIDFEEGTVSVRRSVAPTRKNPNGELCATLKTDSAERTIPLPWSVINELRAAKAVSKSVYVVPNSNGGHFTFSLLTYHWKRMMRGLSFEAHPHLMRHTRITRWFEQGLDIKEVQYLAGHSNPEVTLDIYTHYQKEVRLKETADKIRKSS